MGTFKADDGRNRIFAIVHDVHGQPRFAQPLLDTRGKPAIVFD